MWVGPNPDSRWHNEGMQIMASTIPEAAQKGIACDVPFNHSEWLSTGEVGVYVWDGDTVEPYFFEHSEPWLLQLYGLNIPDEEEEPSVFLEALRELYVWLSVHPETTTRDLAEWLPERTLSL